MDAPICDLVLLSWNHLEETRPCLESLLASTRVSCRLFIVDNGSEQQVRAFLQAVTPRGAMTQITVLQNETNEGFPRGMNRGIRASSAPYVCLLNNDLLFTAGWLREMIDVAQAHPTVGVVNPSSSTFGDRPPGGMTLAEYGASRSHLRGRYVEVGMCIGFCMLIKREVIDRIGLLSEEVERIFFEDEEFCMRAVQAGYQCVVAAGAYVYHAEHKTVRRMPEREAIFTRNRLWCEERWGRRVRLAWPRFEEVVPGSEELGRWLRRLVAWARRRTYVYVYTPVPRGITKERLFESVHLVPHADIHWCRIPKGIARLAALGHILKRRKKPFDLIAAPEPRWAQAIAALRWLHGAAVVPQGNEEQLVAEWKRRSRSRS